jgi:hypothetical protein
VRNPSLAARRPAIATSDSHPTALTRVLGCPPLFIEEAELGKRAIVLALGFWLTTPITAGAEILAGLTAGIVVPGDQDLAFKEYATDHTLVRRNDTDNVNEYVGPLVSGNVAGWGEWSFLRYLGLQLEAAYWHVDVKPGAEVTPAPRFTIGEHRTGIFVNALGRVPIFPSLGTFSSDKGNDTFAYLGAGTGAVYSSVTHGSHDWGCGYQFFGGVSMPILSQLRLRLEARYLLSGDVDTKSRDGLVGWKVDTSGTPTKLRKNETVDTRFVPILVGMDWRF